MPLYLVSPRIYFLFSEENDAFTRYRKDLRVFTFDILNQRRRKLNRKFAWGRLLCGKGKSKYRPNICPSLSVRAACPLIDGARLRHQYFQFQRPQPDRRVAFHDQVRASSNMLKARKPDLLKEIINAPSGCVFAWIPCITQCLEPAVMQIRK